MVHKKYFKTFGCTPQNHCVHARPKIRCSEAVWLRFRLSMYIGSFYLWQLDGPSRSLKWRPPLYKLYINIGTMFQWAQSTRKEYLFSCLNVWASKLRFSWCLNLAEYLFKWSKWKGRVTALKHKIPPGHLNTKNPKFPPHCHGLNIWQVAHYMT